MSAVQLPLAPDRRTAILRRTHAALIARFGRIERAPGERRDPVWTLVQGVIGARTKTPLSNAATDRLLGQFGTWEAVAQAPVEQVASMLRGQTFADQSARRLKACLVALNATRGAADLRHLSNLPTGEAMDWLETLPGVGRKIAAGVMNASTFDRPAIVIDSHHRRIAQRMGLVAPRADTARTFDTLMKVLPPEWSAGDIDEHHMLMKRLGQTLCRPSHMECGACPLARDCVTSQQRLHDGALPTATG